jgi:hypothetical protein
MYGTGDRSLASNTPRSPTRPNDHHPLRAPTEPHPSVHKGEWDPLASKAFGGAGRTWHSARPGPHRAPRGTMEMSVLCPSIVILIRMVGVVSTNCGMDTHVGPIPTLEPSSSHEVVCCSPNPVGTNRVESKKKSLSWRWMSFKSLSGSCDRQSLNSLFVSLAACVAEDRLESELSSGKRPSRRS